MDERLTTTCSITIWMPWIGKRESQVAEGAEAASRAALCILGVAALAGSAFAQSAPEIPRFSTGQAGAPPAAGNIFLCRIRRSRLNI
jgi:hypothetical protein